MNESQLKQIGYVKGDDGEWRKGRNHFTELLATYEEQLKGKPLVGASPRKAKGSDGPIQRFAITFTVYSVYPPDWDGIHIKEIQDMVCEAGILPSDDYRTLEGRVISKKVHTKAEERTVIEILAL